MAVGIRLKQGIRALFAFSVPVDEALAEAYLPPAQMALFRKLRKAEQLHSLNVLRTVLQQEATTPQDLAVAALLHDVGKIRYPMAIWQKSCVVIVRHFLPSFHARWSADEHCTDWRRMFVVGVHHPKWSAELVAQVGGTPRALWLIRHHADEVSAHTHHPDVTLLKRLKSADDAN
jgi:hypothetical protein